MESEFRLFYRLILILFKPIAWTVRFCRSEYPIGLFIRVMRKIFGFAFLAILILPLVPEGHYVFGRFSAPGCLFFDRF